MKKTIRNVYVTIYALALVLIIGGCKGLSAYDYNPYPNIHIEEIVHLTDDSDSPFCDFSMDYSYLNEAGDSIATIINRTTLHELLGEDYAKLSLEVAVDSFKNVYLRNYRTNTGELYHSDVTRHSTQSVPKWYEHTYSIMTIAEEGRTEIINISANYYEDMGGAHPKQWSRWLNFNANTGKLLTLEDVFILEAEKEIKRIMLDKLLQQQTDLYPNETIETLEDLHEKGILQHTDIYITENFLLTKDKILFLFNRYDIAPYAAGEIVLEIAYGEIEHYIKNN